VCVGLYCSVFDRAVVPRPLETRNYPFFGRIKTMKMNKLLCTAALAFAALGLSASARADSIYVDATINEFGNLDGSFELPTLAGQPQSSHHRVSRLCCFRGVSPVNTWVPEFSWFAEPQPVRTGVQSRAEEASAPLNAPDSALSVLSIWAKEDALDDAAFFNDYGNTTANFQLAWSSGALYGGPENFPIGALATSLNLSRQGESAIVPVLIPDPAGYDFDGSRNTFLTGPIRVRRGPVGLPVPIDVPLNVSEPSLLTLLAAGLVVAGLLKPKRAA